ncbi:MAG: radical SAM protein [Acidobacteria bacterium]|nr:radical SAM protein [Acidobacteriota bacterium]
MTASTEFEGRYHELFRSGELKDRVAEARRHLQGCDLCANRCRVNRLETIAGAVCRTGERAVVSSYGPHHGEEDPLRGRAGSGTIFFSWCNLRCVFCQNWEISHKGTGRESSPGEIAEMMIELQDAGCHNINLVSPSHVVAQLLEALLVASGKGLRLPLVYNTGGYDSAESLALLDGIVDIYMPDMKYADSRMARKYSAAQNYVEVNRAAVKEMHRQVGDLVLDSRGVALRGLLVRHLVLPGDLANSDAVLSFLATEISLDTYVNIMSQYYPCYRADEHPPLDRRLRPDEYAAAIVIARKLGLHRLDGMRLR